MDKGRQSVSVHKKSKMLEAIIVKIERKQPYRYYGRPYKIVGAKEDGDHVRIYLEPLEERGITY